jgi:hypothetical protein
MSTSRSTSLEPRYEPYTLPISTECSILIAAIVDFFVSRINLTHVYTKN